MSLLRRLLVDSEDAKMPSQKYRLVYVQKGQYAARRVPDTRFHKAEEQRQDEVLGEDHTCEVKIRFSKYPVRIPTERCGRQ